MPLELAAASSSVAGIITASASVFTALALIITALTLFLPVLRGTRQNTAAITEVHTIVNQQRTDMQRYQRALIESLNEHGIRVPKDQSIADVYNPGPELP